MKKTLLTPVVALAALLMIPAVASAKDMSGRFGLGGDTSLAGVNGISARFQVAEKVGIQAIVDFDQVSFTEESGNNDVDVTNQTFAFALRADFKALQVSDSKGPNLSIFVGINFVSLSVDSDNDVDEDDVDATLTPFELGLRIEHFFGNHFSIHMESGLAVALFDEDNAVLAGVAGLGKGNGQSIKLNTDLLGSAGWTLHF